jgi:DNA-binding MarR family transcriptional regulator
MKYYQQFTYRLHELIVYMDREADKMLSKKFKITFRQFYVLAVIGHLRKESQSQIASSLQISRAAVSKQLPQLTKMGWTGIASDINNNKKQLIFLTVKGRKVVSNCQKYLEEEFKKKIGKNLGIISRCQSDIDKLINILFKVI